MTDRIDKNAHIFIEFKRISFNNIIFKLNGYEPTDIN